MCLPKSPRDSFSILDVSALSKNFKSLYAYKLSSRFSLACSSTILLGLETGHENRACQMSESL